MKTEEKVRAKLQELARKIGNNLPSDWGFILLTFPFGEGEGPMLYVAKAGREDALTAMQEFIDKNKADHKFGCDQWFEQHGPK